MLRMKKHRAKRDVLGFRLPMLVHEEPELDVTEIMIVDPDNTFFMRMGSDAMASYHILENHILVIDRTLQPVPGSIVVFFHEGGFYTREYCPEPNRVVLKSDEKDMVVDEFVCWGVVMLFMTLEDETGSANLVVWQQLFDRYRKEIVQSKLLMVAGKLQVANGVTHLVVRQCFNLSVLLRSLTEAELPQTLMRGDETTQPVNYDGRSGPPVLSAEAAMHKGRNFH